MMKWIILGVVAVVAVLVLTPISFGSLPLEGEYQIKVTVNGREMTALMENTRPSMAFKKMITSQPRTIKMRDYGSMEKVGMLYRVLPAQNRNITTEPGDIILYMRSALVVYYRPNSWNFTKLGHIINVPQQELQEIFGDGPVTMTFELSD